MAHGAGGGPFDKSGNVAMGYLWRFSLEALRELREGVDADWPQWMDDINLDAIADLATREVVRQVLNSIEQLAAENAALRRDVQHLRDEHARLKSGSGKPDITPSVPPPPADHSSEHERQTRTPHSGAGGGLAAQR